MYCCCEVARDFVCTFQAFEDVDDGWLERAVHDEIWVLVRALNA